MYELGYRTRKRPYKLIGAILCVLLLAGCVITYKTLHLTTAPRGSIVNSSTHTSDYQPESSSHVPVDMPQFTLKLPTGWIAVTKPEQKFSQGGYDFRSPSADARMLSVYIDTVPADLAINRALTVSDKGDHISYGTVSDNCSTYTQASKVDPGSGHAMALWQGASFICDLGNFQRNVVGTVSMDGINYLTLQSPDGRSHKLFMTYTDNGPSPNYGVFYSILDSFRLK